MTQTSNEINGKLNFSQIWHGETHCFKCEKEYILSPGCKHAFHWLLAVVDLLIHHAIIVKYLLIGP